MWTPGYLIAKAGRLWSGWTMKSPFRAKMVIGMIGRKGDNTIELGDYGSVEEARLKGTAEARALLRDMPRITIFKTLVVEDMVRGTEHHFGLGDSRTE